jgi:predicted RNase H-like nuclease
VRVLGVDGCKAGWVAVALEDGRFAGARVVPVFEDLLGETASVIGVDIPLGETVPGARRADAAARRRLGRRHATVFTPAPLAAAAAPTYRAASDIARRLTGKAITQQAWHLLPKMIDASKHWAQASDRIREIHPECSFGQMKGEPLLSRKKTPEGRRERIDLLARVGIILEGSPDEDHVDAAAVAWSAHRVACDTARSLPDPPERDAEGRPVAIWY